MKILTIILLWTFSQVAQAHIAEFYGPSTQSVGLANQASLSRHDPGISYYSAALMAHERTFSLSANSMIVSHNFKDIADIVVENNSNSNLTNPRRGDIDIDYRDIYMAAIHGSVPVAGEGNGILLFNVFTPIGAIAEVNSGDEFLPEYVMYRSRLERTNAFVHYARPISENFSFSLGVQLSFQVGSDVGTQASLNGTNYGSSANLKARIKPTLGLVTSFAYQTQQSHIYLSYQQEMKSNLLAVANGEINDPTSALFSLALESMAYYDPHIMRLGLAHQLNSFMTGYITAEYQIWSGYQTPVIRIQDRGGVLLPSDDYEQVTTQNIFVPKVAVEFEIGENKRLSLGGLYRPTPLRGDFSGSGNSVDTDLWALALGGSWEFTLLERAITLGAAGQYHQLKNIDVTKNEGQEDGSPGLRIGAPGYSVGGSTLVFTTGLTIGF